MKTPPAPYPGTRFTAGSIYRASAAINDALRQLGRVGTYETPDHLPDLEHIGIWLHHSGSACIPIVIRLSPDGSATAYLAPADGTASPPLPYRDQAPRPRARQGPHRGLSSNGTASGDSGVKIAGLSPLAVRMGTLADRDRVTV